MIKRDSLLEREKERERGGERENPLHIKRVIKEAEKRVLQH